MMSIVFCRWNTEVVSDKLSLFSSFSVEHFGLHCWSPCCHLLTARDTGQVCNHYGCPHMRRVITDVLKCVCLNIHVCACVLMWMCVHMYVCLHVCVCLCVCMCVCAYMCSDSAKNLAVDQNLACVWLHVILCVFCYAHKRLVKMSWFWFSVHLQLGFFCIDWLHIHIQMYIIIAIDQNYNTHSNTLYAWCNAAWLCTLQEILWHIMCIIHALLYTL